MKEEIIEEIKLNVTDIIFNREAGWSDKLEKSIDFWITKAITETQQETVKKVIQELKKFEVYDDEADNCRRIISELSFFVQSLKDK